MAVEYKVGKSTVHLVKGDITEMETDAVVNAANSSLMGGGGVDGAIHFKGGPQILKECKKIRENQWPEGLPTGKAVITSGGKLKAKYVIHTVGPIWRGGNKGEPDLLADAYKNSLEIAVSSNLKTISFPSISTGAYGYPLEKACPIAFRTVSDFLKNHEGLSDVFFVYFSNRSLNICEKLASKILSD